MLWSGQEFGPRREAWDLREVSMAFARRNALVGAGIWPEEGSLGSARGKQRPYRWLLPEGLLWSGKEFGPRREAWVLREAGKDLPDIKGSVFWETSVATAGGDSPFRQKTKSAARALPMTLPADPALFAHHMKNKKTPVAFNSFGGTLLVIPPDTGKNFSHLATFYKHSSDAEKRALWKKVAVELQRKLKRGETVYVSTHGTGVSWLHVRLASRPMYYVTSVA
ncbi:EsV-1-207 [Ectocarpus siliculosus]|uniref:EsV-1-207 n=1 Tax=Ectocarpus siliculosus TaxID=2880 RepID=D7FZG8_ECTSI|nr:EsV-1-207 [Ectocarpus siliculosus]|eukprot:CBJ49278.1 EsV-1-207 [Ectocarpus siliculosus]